MLSIKNIFRSLPTQRSLKKQLKKAKQQRNQLFHSVSHAGTFNTRRLALGSAVLSGLSLGLVSLMAGQRLWHQRQAAKSSLPKPSVLNPEKLIGNWYELARTPIGNKQAIQAKVHYELKDAKKLAMTYTYQLQEAADAPTHKQQTDLRWQAPTPGRWYKKQFFGLFEQAEWIIEMGEKYSYIVLGTPSRKHLRLLSRLPVMNSADYTEILSRMEAHGFDVSRVQPVPQEEKAPAPLFAHLQDLQQKKRKYYQSGEQSKQHGPKAHERNGWMAESETAKNSQD